MLVTKFLEKKMKLTNEIKEKYVPQIEEVRA
jgi:hypothetical protein